MSEIKKCTKGLIAPYWPFYTLHYKFEQWRADPDYFKPEGIWVFCGAQGSGKTLSAVQTLLKMKELYPAALVCSNMDLQNVDFPIIPFTDYAQLGQISNGTHGVIFLIDEIQVLWNSLESKQIPFSEMAEFCQMRKNRRVIIGTSQVYGRIAKPIREQLKYVIMCRNYFGLLQVNEVCDPQYSVEINGTIAPDLICTRLWWHTPDLYEHFDTLGKIVRIDRYGTTRI